MAEEYAVTVVAVTGTAGEFTTSLGTAGSRKMMGVYNLSHTNSGEVYMGPSGVTPATGFVLEKGKFIELPLTDNLATFFIAETGELGDLRVLEISE